MRFHLNWKQCNTFYFRGFPLHKAGCFLNMRNKLHMRNVAKIPHFHFFLLEGWKSETSAHVLFSFKSNRAPHLLQLKNEVL